MTSLFTLDTSYDSLQCCPEYEQAILERSGLSRRHGTTRSTETQAAAPRRTRLEHAVETAQDYVEAIADLSAIHGEARAVDLARRLGVTHVTVIRTVARLKRDGYVSTRPYRSIFLTEKGSRVAAESRRRHEVVVAFLRSIGISEGEMRFGAVSLELDWDINVTGKAEFTFTGFDEMDETSGKGCAVLAQGRLVGRLISHQIDKSGFIAERWKAAKHIFLSARLPGFTGRGDKLLGEIAQELRRVLLKTQNSSGVPSCRLPDAAWSDVAVLLVEWAEDVHNDVGLCARSRCINDNASARLCR